MSVNRAILVGNAGRDAEVRKMGDGDKVASFSVATSETWRDKATGDRREATEWHNVVIFNQALVGIAEQYVKKGTKVSIEGAIKTRSYEDRDGVTRKATEIVIGRTRTRETAPAAAETAATRPMRDVIDDDIPF